MMKPAIYLLTFYLLLLSVIPCCAFDECPDDPAAPVQSAGHSESQEERGSCSPFFPCGECAFVVIDAGAGKQTAFFLPGQKFSRGYLPPGFPEMHYDFWQPPQLDQGNNA